MKTRAIKWFALMLSVSTVISVEAQTTDELLKLGSQEVQSSARFTGMGGAFNALGGDVGSLSVNPAGIGVYRTSEFSVTPDVTVGNSTTTFMNESASDNRTRLGLPSIGYISAWTTNNTTGLISLNFGIAYNRTANYYGNSTVRGFGSSKSVLDYFEKHANYLADKRGTDYIRGNVGKDEYNKIIPNDWSTALAYDTYMLDYDEKEGKYKLSGLEKNDLVDISGRNVQSGGSGEYAFSIGGNVSNKFQFGFTLGLQDLEMSNHLSYKENYVKTNKGAFTSGERDEYTSTTGLGINVKAGFIYRLTDAFRIGFAAHTPTFFDMKRKYSVNMSSLYWDNANSKDIPASKNTPSDLYEYSMTTPYRLEAGLAYIVGRVGLLSVDYELVGNNSMRMRDNNPSAYTDSYNNEIKNSYQASSNLRLGAEFNLPYGIMLRGGYNYFQSPFKDSKLDFSRRAYSVGFGFRNKSFFADLAFVMNTGNYHYVPYFVNDNRFRDTDANDNPNIAVEKSNQSRIVATIGFKIY